MIDDIELVHRHLRDATATLSEIINESDFVEYKLIGVKRELLKADYHFAGVYIKYLAERADIDCKEEGQDDD